MAINSPSQKTEIRLIMKSFLSSLSITLIKMMIILLTSAGPAQSQVPQNTIPDRRITIETIIDCFDRHYVLPEIIPALKDSLYKNLKNGKYSEAENKKNFLFLLSEDLRFITGDKHVRLNYVGKSEKTAGQHKHSVLEPSIEMKERANYGFRKVEWLPGNIGYLRFDSFADEAYAGEKLTSAITYLRDCDAIILDLRYNGGGEETMVKFLASYFIEEPTLLNQMYFPRQDSLWQSWTSGYVPGKKLTNIDLYILTSQFTASAAEAFTYSLQNLGRATIIGEISSGAAHWVDYFYYPELNMEIKLPIARPINPITKTNWEKKGVIPDIEIAEYLAFEVAHLTALEKIVAEIDNTTQKADLKWYITVIKEQTKDEKKWDINLEEYSGKYENLEFIIKNGHLWWHRSDDEENMIIPLSKDNFVFTDTEDYIIKFIRNHKGNIEAYQFLVRWRNDSPVYKKMD